MTKSDSNFTQTFVHPRLLPGISFNGHYFTISVNNIDIPPKKKYIYMCAYMYAYIYTYYIYIYIYISYTLNPLLRNLNKYFSFSNSIFGSVKVTKHLIQINTNIVATT